MAAGSTAEVGIAVDGATRAVVIGVCINDKGPFPFLLDTGSSVSYLSRALAQEVGLRLLGRAFDFGPVGCSAGRARATSLSSWSAGGIVLAKQPVVVGSLGSAGRGIRLDGLLGSDVLARFGAVRIDYNDQTLGTEAAESAPFTGSVRADAGPASAFDTSFPPLLDTGMRVVSSGGFVQPTTSVIIKAKPRRFIVDTGASLVDVGSKLARYIGLRPVAVEMLTATNCGRTVPFYVGGSGWTLGDVPLAAQEIGGIPQPNANFGLLGSTVLSAAGAAVVDYDDGRLLLTASAR